jgi:hypothetical protein
MVPWDLTDDPSKWWSDIGPLQLLNRHSPATMGLRSAELGIAPSRSCFTFTYYKPIFLGPFLDFTSHPTPYPTSANRIMSLFFGYGFTGTLTLLV